MFSLFYSDNQICRRQNFKMIYPDIMSTRARQVFHTKVDNDYHYRLCFIFDLGTKKRLL